MTKTQAIAIKVYCEGAYPQMKDKGGSDEVWVDMLADYAYQEMLGAVKRYIASGNEYPPSIAALLKNYREAKADAIDQIAEEIIKSRVFDDPENTPEEIRAWNRENRKQKMMKLFSWPRNLWPSWLREEYEKHETAATSLLPPPNLKMLQ